MIYDIILNIEKSGIKPRIKVSQYDKTLPQIRATLYSNNQAFNIPSGSKVYISGTKKDNTGFKYECTYSNNEITADITEQMTAFSGDVEVEFTIESSGSRKGTENFILEVEPAALEDDVIISETDIPAIQRLSRPASTTQLGVVKVDGTSITVDEDGTLHSSGGGGGAVQSVNGKTGAVVLDADDIDDTNTTNKFTNATEKQAWNGKSTVSVTQIKSSGEKIATINVNGTDTDLYASAGGGGGGAVDSVNGKTGAVVLTASDVGALADNTPIPSDLSDLSDVDTSGVTDGQILKYNATSGKFLPSNESGGGTSDYTDLTNKPSINGVTLSGNKTSADLGISGGSNENLLLNPWFNVNTKGFTSANSLTTGNTTVDKWKIYGSTSSSDDVTVSKISDGIRFHIGNTVLSSYMLLIAQRVNHSLNNGDTITFSFIVNDELKQVTGTIDSSSDYPIYRDAYTLSNGAKLKFMVDRALGYWRVMIGLDSQSVTNVNVDFKSLKLELGSASTLELDIAPNENLEMVRCNGVMRSNRNLLDNPWFTVNQKGFTSGSIATIGESVPFIDRWKGNYQTSATSSISLSNNQLTLTIPSGVGCGISQGSEVMQTLTSGTATVSIMFADGTIISKNITLSATPTVYQLGTYNDLTIDYRHYATLNAFLFVFNNESGSQKAVTIKAVKFELGTESTLALDVEPNYTEELLKCQRSYYPLPRKWFANTAGINQYTQVIFIPLPTKMRTTPTLLGSLDLEGAYNGASVTETVATASVVIDSNDLQNIYATITSTNQYDRNGWVLVKPSSSAALSAEL